MATKAQHAHDQETAHKLAELGMTGSLRLLMEARAAGLSQSLALGLREQESGTRGHGNVFGHDASGNHVGAGTVTKKKYLAYKAKRGATGRGGMQGVGPLQLTFYTFQDEADRLGGCWLPRWNYCVGFRHLAHLIQMSEGSERHALGVYNGGSRNPNYDYADSVLKHKHRWHQRLT